MMGAIGESLVASETSAGAIARMYEMKNAPSSAEYVRVLRKREERVTERQRRLFNAHFHAPERMATATQLAAWTGGAGGWSAVNSSYGRLGHTFCDELGIKPDLRPDDTNRWWSVWSRGWSAPEGFIWQMLPQVADALETLGWIEGIPLLPEELPPDNSFIEGVSCRIMVNAYERHSETRRHCIQEYGTDCYICGVNFGAVYGKVAEGFIHVHHLPPLSEIRRDYLVDPIKDLRPVCPNCHAVLHQRNPPYSIEDVKEMLRRVAQKSL